MSEPLNPLQRWTITGEEPDEDDMPCGTMATPDPEGQWVSISDVWKLGVAYCDLQQQVTIARGDMQAATHEANMLLTENRKLEQQLVTVTQELEKFRGLFGDYGEPPRTFEQAEMMWNTLKARAQ